MALSRVDYITPTDPGNTIEGLNLEKVSGEPPQAGQGPDLVFSSPLMGED
jgi:hypothetical protein